MLGLGRGRQDAVRSPVELHEHQVPDLQIAVAVAFADAAFRAAGNLFALVDEDLGAGAARPGIAHGPEVVFLPQPHDAARRQPGDLLPEAGGFLVLMVNRGPEALPGEMVMPGQQLPGHFDGPFLEVIAEGEVAQHLEEGMVAGGEAHVFQVVVLAPGPDALLGAGGPGVGPGFFPQEDLFELHHAGVGE